MTDLLPAPARVAGLADPDLLFAPAEPRAAAEYLSPYAGTRVTSPRVLLSEWRKLWTLRSTWWVVGATIVLMAGFALLFAFVIQTALNDPATQMQMEATGGDSSAFFNGVVAVTLGYQFAQLTVAVLGVLAISNEYSSGMIRATFSAAPNRIAVLVAKWIVLAVTTAALAIIGLALSWAVTYPLLRRDNLTIDLGNSATQRSLLGVVLYLVAIVTFALAIGALIRHTAGGIATVVAIMMVLPMIFSIVIMTANAPWAQTIYKYLPTEAGGVLIQGSEASAATGGMMGAAGMQMLAPWHGFAVLAGYALVTFAAACVMIRARDA